MVRHRVDYDLMRIIACFLVIFNHLDGYTLYQRENDAGMENVGVHAPDDDHTDQCAFIFHSWRRIAVE